MTENKVLFDCLETQGMKWYITSSGENSEGFRIHLDRILEKNFIPEELEGGYIIVLDGEILRITLECHSMLRINLTKTLKEVYHLPYSPIIEIKNGYCKPRGVNNERK